MLEDLPSGLLRRIVYQPLQRATFQTLSSTTITQRQIPMADQGLFREKSIPITTFKNSLRLWQARWKAQQTSSPPRPPEGGQQQTQNEAPPK